MRRYLFTLFLLIAPGQAVLGSQDASNTMPTVAPLRSLDKTSSGAGTPAATSNNQAPPTSGTGVAAAPGADAMMTRDLLLVSPDKGKQPPKPLQDFIGNTLTLTLGRTGIILDGLRGIMITVNNDTNRSLFVDGDSTKAICTSHEYSAAPISVVQKSVLPSSSAIARVYRLLDGTAEAGLTVGLIPTVKDYITMKKPISKRYGADEHRRIVEASRFGKRILWPHQTTQGILYFKTKDTFANVKIQIPVHTLFDKTDNAILNSQ